MSSVSSSSSSSCWTCTTCTLLNPATKRRCQACNSRKPVIEEQQQQQQVVNHPFETTTTTTLIAIATTASTKTKTKNRKRKIPERKTSTVTSTTTDSSSISDNISSITTTTTTTTDESVKRGPNRKRNRKTSSADDHIGDDDDDDDGNVDTTIPIIKMNKDVLVKDLNDDTDIHTDVHIDIESTKKIHSTSTINNINASNASAASCIMSTTSGKDSNSSTVTTYDDENNFNNNIGSSSYKESVAKSPQLLCLDNNDSNIAEEEIEEEQQQQQQQQQDEQSTSINHHDVDIENHHRLIPELTITKKININEDIHENHHNFKQQEQQRQEQEQPPNSNVVNSIQSPASVDDEKKAPHEKQSKQIIIIKSPLLQLQLAESKDQKGKQENNNENMLNSCSTNDNDGIETMTMTTTTTSTRSSEEEENNSSSIERNNFDDVVQITSTTATAISETIISELKMRASGEEEISSASTTAAATTTIEEMSDIIMDTRKEVLSHTINQNNDNDDDAGNFNNDNDNNKNSSTDEVTTTTMTLNDDIDTERRDIADTITPTSKMNTKPEELTDIIITNNNAEVSIIASLIEPNENIVIDTLNNNGTADDAELMISNDELLTPPSSENKISSATTRLPVPDSSQQPEKDFDTRQSCSLRGNNEDTINATTTKPQSPSAQQQQQIQDNRQADDMCIDENNKYNPSTTQSQSSPFAYPMSTSFAYTPPGTGTQSSQEGMAEGDHDDDDDEQQQDDQQGNGYIYRQSMQVSQGATDNRSGIEDLKMADLSSSSLSNHPRENSISYSPLAMDQACLQEETTANNNNYKRKPAAVVTIEGEPKSNMNFPFRTTLTSASIKTHSAVESEKIISNPLALFQTAGTGSSISVSKESVEKYGKLLNTSSRKESDSRKTLPEASSTSPPQIYPTTTSKKAAISSTKTPMDMFQFQTAGTGSSISVSKESVEKYGKLLNTSPRKDSDSRKTLPGASSTSPTYPTTTSKAPMAMFQTAGTGSSISVSKESVEEMGKILSKSSTSRKESPSRKILTEAASKNAAPSSASTNISMAMFQTAGSGATIRVSEERLEDAGRMLNKSSSSSNDSASKKVAFSVASSLTRTAIAFQTPRSNTMTINNSAGATETNVSAAMMAMFQTAGSGATIRVSEERLEDAGRMLNKSSSSSKESDMETVDEETVGRRESSNAIEGRLYTPTKDVMATPHQNIVRFGSIRRATYGSTPLAFSNNDDRDYVVPLKPVAEDNAQGDCQIQATVPGQDLHSSPKEYNMASKSANVTMSAGDSILVRKRKGEQNGAMTPVPINFSNKLGTPDAFETPGLIESTTRYNSPNTEDCPTLQDAIRLGIMSKCPKVCRLNGVREVTMSVNCENALQLRFDSKGLPVAFALNTEDDHFASLGRIDYIRKALITNCCDSNRIKDSWIRNHTRWIVWKLASYEKSFSRFLGGNHLTYQMLIHNLTSRFRKELIEGVRPAIRKILNRDIAPSKMICLVVCRIIPSPKSKSDDTPQPLKIVELSDGWYSVKGCLDKKMSEYIDLGLITVGTKLLVSNARLMGLEEGVDPLDEGDGTSCENCKGALQLTVNACRLARWNAKLGFVKATNNERMSNGRLLVKRISDVVPGGGDIPAIRLFIQRVYPMLYYEKSEHCSQVLTVQEEDTMRREFENRKLKVIEKLTDRIQAEVEQVRIYVLCVYVYVYYISD
jgi:hypothetical protein